MNSKIFQESIERRLGNYAKLPDYPFDIEMTYAIFPGAEDYFIDKSMYEALFKINAKYGNEQLLIKPHFVDASQEKLFLKQSTANWSLFNEIQKKPLTCEGIYLSGNLFNWLGIYHYDDYLIVGGEADFIKDLCNTVYGDSDWKTRFINAFNEGEMSMYQNDYESLVEKLL